MADNRDRLRLGGVQNGQTLQSIDVSRDRENAQAQCLTGAFLIPAKGTKRKASYFETNKKMKITPSHLSSYDTKSKSSDLDIPHDLVVRSGIERIPLSQDNGQGPASKSVSPSAYIEIATIDSMEIAAKGMLSASGYDKYYLEQFHKFYEDYTACNIKTANLLLKLENNNTEKHYENLSLERRLNVMTQQTMNLEDKLSRQEKLYAAVHQKYIDALKTRIAVENGCKSLTNQQEAELDRNYSEITWLKAELNNIQESNRGLANMLSNIQVKLKETEESVSNLLSQNNNQAAELKEQKLKIQNTVAEQVALKHQSFQLESELKQKTLKCNDLRVNFEALQSLTEEITNQLEFSRNENETKNNSLHELEGLKNSLIRICEEYYRESVAHEETISSLRSSFSQQSQDLEKLAKSYEELKAANLQELSLHSEELQKYEAQAMNLREVIKSFETEVQVQAQSMQAEKESLVVELDELRKSISSLKDDKEQMENDKKIFGEEVENTTHNLKNTIFSLQEDLKKKEIELIGLEHEKDGIITQLNNKINTICSTIKQPIFASKLSKNDKDNKINTIEIESDFESEDEMPLKTFFFKRQNLAVVKPQNDVFDALKNGTI